MSLAEIPADLTANAWDGEGAVAGVVDRQSAVTWALGPAPPGRYLRPPAAPDERDYTDPRVGWGLVLPDTDDVPVESRATAAGAPEPVRDLVAARPGAKVLRWHKELGPMALRDYATGSPIPLSGGPAGGAENGLPRYLLLYGGPDVLPWWLQYVLNAGNFVGRLHLEGEGLENYVSALLDGWRDSRSRYDRPVVWAPDFGGADMTAVMHRTLATPLADKLRADPDGDMAGIVTLESDAATAAGLRDALVASTPSLVVTTSHGQTAPLANPVALRRDVGKLVDQERSLVEPGDLLAKWQPDGAIWYAHACCSAGADSPSAFAELFPAGSGLRELLEGVSAVAPVVAPLPTALLGAKRPLRAFVGHVEPTFDWTIRFPWDGQRMTAGLVGALYDGLCGGEPVGHALRRVWGPIGSIASALQQARKLINAGQARREEGLTSALYLQVVWRDREGTVILGDPVAAIGGMPTQHTPQR